MRALFLSCLIGVLVALCSAAAADDDVCGPPKDSVPRKVVSDLIGWIALHTDYDIAEVFAAPPAISFCHIGDTIPYEDRLLHIEPFVRATYDLPRDSISLVSPWSADSPKDRSVLLHELVHVIQLRNRDWPCVGAPELEAYLLQTAYLAQYGIDPNFNWPAIIMLSRCPEPAETE